MAFGRLCFVIACVMAAGAVSPARAQPARRAATVEALLTYPTFYGGQHVVVLAEMASGVRTPQLLTRGAPIYVVSRESVFPHGVVELRGEFWDLARLPVDDPRLANHELVRALSERERPPQPGEAFVIVARSIQPAGPAPAPGIRVIALDPQRYLDQRVTVAGQFRGRNLYGDLPQAPGLDRWDFVLRSADAAIWVTGVRPRGRGFDLDVGARVDTSNWLEVRGVVRSSRGLVWIEANQVAMATPAEETVAGEAPGAPVVGPSPEVVFSAPIEGEADVEPGTLVRIQFSRDLDASTIAGQVRVSYVAREAMEASEAAPAVDFTTEYDGAQRVLVLRFGQRLDPSRTLRIELLDGIRAFDGAPLKPWELTFTVAG